MRTRMRWCVALGLGATLSLATVLRAEAQDSLPPDLRPAQAALDAGRIEQAIDLAQRYTWRHRRDARGYLMLGQAYEQRMPAGRFRAVNAYQEAERLDRTNPEPSYRIGMIGFRIGGDDGERLAGAGLARTLGKDPLYQDAWPIWLELFRAPSDRHDMLDRLWPHRSMPEVRARIARLLMEDEQYARADSLLAVSLATDSTNVAWLALAAQSAFEAGDTLRGLGFHRRALANAVHDSTDALWRQVVGIASPEEIRAWAAGVPPAERAAWLRMFWAKRHPDLFDGMNRRIAEHFTRWRVARRQYPLLHPLIGFQREAAARALQLEPSPAERSFHVRCEITDAPAKAPRAPPIGIQYRPMGPTARGGDRLWWWSPTELAAEKERYMLGVKATGFLDPTLLDAFQDPIYPLLGLDLRGADSVAARVGYNLATGLSDRGLTILRFGLPDRQHLGGKNDQNPECNTTELEYWTYDDYGTLRFAKPVAFSEGLRTLPEVVFRPMEFEQFALTKQVLVEDRTAVPAPLEFGVWTAAFPDLRTPGETDLIVVTTNGAIAASLMAEGIGSGVQIHRDGVAELTAPPGTYPLLVHAREGEVLGRQQLRVTLPRFAGDSALSSFLLTKSWATPPPSRRDVLAHIQRDLSFVAGDTVRAYTEIATPGGTPEGLHYLATYLLLKTTDVQGDYAKTDWPGAVKLEFERRSTASDRPVIPEVLDILPLWIPKGTYLLRLEVRALPAERQLGRATVAFEIR